MSNLEYTKIAIPEEQVADLYRRLAETRWPVSPEGTAWEYGTSLVYLRDVVSRWLTQFNWRKQEALLNQYTHVLASREGRRIHAALAKAEKSSQPPVLLAHGWPGSFVEFLEVAERLAHPEKFGGVPEEGCDVVMVSLPGCGLSSAPSTPMGPREIAKDVIALCQSLGIQKFFMHGSDWGAAVASWLAWDAPETLHGIHITSTIMQPTVNDESQLSTDEKNYLAYRSSRGPWDSGYRVMQGTKPLTLSYALTDSPAGLAAWLLEKFQHWSESQHSESGPTINLDLLLTIISFYWFAGPGPASWIYRSLIDGTGLVFKADERVVVPTGLCRFRHDISPVAPPEWQERCYNIVTRSEVNHGGHFPGLDAPAALSDDIRAFMTRVLQR